MKSFEYALKELRDAVGASTTLDKPVALVQEITSLVEGGGGGASLDAFISGDSKSVTYNGELVPYYAFAYKHNLREVDLPNATIIGRSAFSSAGILPGSASTDSQDYGFDFINHSLDTVNAPKVTNIQELAYSCGGFSGSEFGIRIFNHGDDLVLIGNRAFEGCKRLAEFYFNEGLLILGETAFFNSGITEITLPNSLTSISKSAFGSCDSLTAVTLGNAVVEISYQAFEGDPITSIKIPHTVSTIDYHAFYSYIDNGVHTLTNIDMTEFDTTAGLGQIPNLTGGGAFGSTFYFDSNTKFIFKNQETLDVFSQDSNWSVYSNYFVVQS